MTADDDYKLLQVGIGFTNMVARATKGSADLTRKEIKEGMLVSDQYQYQYQINYMYRRHFFLISAVY
jgi:hypothetical protein